MVVSFGNHAYHKPVLMAEEYLLRADNFTQSWYVSKLSLTFWTRLLAGMVFLKQEAVVLALVAAMFFSIL